uniref:Uncharacterized protein n=1 Tax=Arundo donax TaxID=35708 RepID=A0A0A9F1R5_ARUDO
MRRGVRHTVPTPQLTFDLSSICAAAPHESTSLAALLCCVCHLPTSYISRGARLLFLVGRCGEGVGSGGGRVLLYGWGSPHSFGWLNLNRGCGDDGRAS